MKSSSFRVVDACRVCEARGLLEVFSLGETPLANSFVRPDSLAPEERFPLALVRCARCGLVQLSVVVAPEIMFRNYLYTSSTSPPMVEHFAQLAEQLVERFSLAGALAVEVGSNDGILLRPLASRGVRVLGIEPASNLATQARAAGLDTWNEFFGESVARRILAERGVARLVTGHNVIAHIDDVRGVARGIEALLAPDGVFVMEAPYLVDLLERVEYDTVYHEHLSYFALRPLVMLFDHVGLEVFDAQRVPIHGGSLRVFVGRSGRFPRDDSVAALLQLEGDQGLDGPGAYREFSERVSASRSALVGLLATLKESGARVAGYGAAAKGTTLLNYCGIDDTILDFVVDSTPLKQGLLTPGTRIPVVPEAELTKRSPGYALLLAWNYADAIVARNHPYVQGGGRFIHPIPLARIIDS